MTGGLDFEELRRHLLKVIVSELSGGNVRPADVLSPTCPVCGEGPAMVLPAGTQAFCGNEACDVLMWDPTQSDAQVHGGTEIDLRRNTDG